MFGIKTRKINERIECEVQMLRSNMNSYRAMLYRKIDTLESRIRALEEATKPKSRKVTAVADPTFGTSNGGPVAQLVRANRS